LNSILNIAFFYLFYFRMEEKKVLEVEQPKSLLFEAAKFLADPVAAVAGALIGSFKEGATLLLWTLQQGGLDKLQKRLEKAHYELLLLQIHRQVAVSFKSTKAGLLRQLTLAAAKENRHAASHLALGVFEGCPLTDAEKCFAQKNVS
jgi:hypothetical protein